MDMETCSACSQIKDGKIGTQKHGMLQFVGLRRSTFIRRRDSDVEEYICHDCGSWWEHNVRGDDVSGGWRFIKKMSHTANTFS
jgi:hypothetical protein